MYPFQEAIITKWPLFTIHNRIHLLITYNSTLIDKNWNSNIMIKLNKKNHYFIYKKPTPIKHNCKKTPTNTKRKLQTDTYTYNKTSTTKQESVWKATMGLWWQKASFRVDGVAKGWAFGGWSTDVTRQMGPGRHGTRTCCHEARYPNGTWPSVGFPLFFMLCLSFEFFVMCEVVFWKFRWVEVCEFDRGSGFRYAFFVNVSVIINELRNVYRFDKVLEKIFIRLYRVIVYTFL